LGGGGDEAGRELGSGGLWRALKAILTTALLSAAALVAGVGFVLALVTFDLMDDEAAVAAFGPLIVYAAGGTIFVVAALFAPGGWRKALALESWTLGRDFLICVVAVLATFAAEEWLESMFPALAELFVLPAPTKIRLWIIVAVVLAAPVVEEIVFRGYLYTRLRRTLPVPFALIVTALLFSAAHWYGDWLYPLLVLPVGLVLGYARERLGSTLPCMILHMIYNAGAVAAELLRI